MNVSWKVTSAAFVKELNDQLFVSDAPVGNGVSMLSWLPSSAVQRVGVIGLRHQAFVARFLLTNTYITLRAGDSQVSEPAG